LGNGFIGHLYTRLVGTNNHSGTANLRTSQTTTAPAKPFLACCRCLAKPSKTGGSSASRDQVLSSQSPVHNSSVQVQVQVTLRLTVSQSVGLGIEHRRGAHDQIFNAPRPLRSCFCWAPSLTGGWVCLLYMLLALASAVFLGPQSFGTCDHILLSHI
jgi:hypothetical protein